jgi:ankyrin repeat protein
MKTLVKRKLIFKPLLINRLGHTPLAMAVVNDYVYMIERLLELGADPNIADYNGDTPLIKTIWSVSNNDAENEQIFKIVKALIEHGANVNAENDNGRTALFTAIYQNNTDIALCLIENGATLEYKDIHKENFTLLHYACYQGLYFKLFFSFRVKQSSY